MRITVTIDDDLLARAGELTGIVEPAELLSEALDALVRAESARRLAALEGTDPSAMAAPRRGWSAREGRREQG